VRQVFQDLAELMDNSEKLIEEFVWDYEEYLEKYLIDDDIFKSVDNRPLYLDTPFRTKNKYHIKARIDFKFSDFENLSQQYIIRCFTIIPENSALGKFATCFFKPFWDLKNMMENNQDIDMLIKQFVEYFESHDEVNKISVSANRIYEAKTPFKTLQGGVWISAYFSDCWYYEGKDTPYFLKWFFVPVENYIHSVETTDQKLALGLWTLYIGNKMGKDKEQVADPILARKHFNDIHSDEKLKTVFESLLQTQKSLIYKTEKNKAKMEKQKLLDIERERHQKEEKDRLIQQFSHTLRSSLIVQKANIENIIKNNRVEMLTNVLSEIERIANTLHLLSLSARNPEQLKQEVFEGLSDAGFHLGDIFFFALSSAVKTILYEERYREHVLESRYLKYSGSHKIYNEKFSNIREHHKQELLEKWKQEVKLKLRSNEERQKIDSIGWDILPQDGLEWIFYEWLVDEHRQHLENFIPNSNSDEFIQWFNKAFLRLETDIGQSLCFKSRDNYGAVYLFLVISEICLNTLKYAESGSIFSVRIGRTEEKVFLYFSNQIGMSFRIGSGAGLEVLKIMMNNIGGSLNELHSLKDNRFEVRIEIPITQEGKAIR